MKPRAPSSIASRTSDRIRSSSAAVGGRSAPPMTSRRSVLWPTNVVTLVAGRAASDGLAIAADRGPVPRDAREGEDRLLLDHARAGSPADSGPAEKPHSPTACVVIPCSIALRQPGSLSSDTSEWVCRSMKPGATGEPARGRSLRGRRPRRRARRPTRCGRHRWRGRPATAGPPVPSWMRGVAEHGVDHSRASPPDVTYRSQWPHGAELSTSVTPSPYRQPRASSRCDRRVGRAPGMRTRAMVAPSSAAPADRGLDGGSEVGRIEDRDRADRAVGLDVRVAGRPDRHATTVQRVEPGHRAPELVVLGPGDIERGTIDGRQDVRAGQAGHEWVRDRPPRPVLRPRAAAPAGTSRTGRRARSRRGCARRCRPSAGSPVGPPPGPGG